MTKRFGFTLAEVLIALTIIGVISVLTVPSLITNIDSQTNQTKLKKAYAAINQVVGMTLADNGYDATDAKAYKTQGVTMKEGIMSIIARNISGQPISATAWKSSDGLIYAFNDTNYVTGCTVYNTDVPKLCGYLTIITKGTQVKPDDTKLVGLDSSMNLTPGLGFKIPFYKNGTYFITSDTSISSKITKTSTGTEAAAARVINSTVGDPDSDPVPKVGSGS